MIRLPDRGRPGEADLADQRVLDQPPPRSRRRCRRRPRARPRATRPRGPARRGASAVSGRQLGRLEHHRVAAGQRRAELPAGDQQREVPRRDQRRPRRAARGTSSPRRRPPGSCRPRCLSTRAGVVVEHVGHRADLAATGGDRLADVGRLELRQLLGVLVDRVGQPAAAAGPDRSGRQPATPAGPAAARSTAASTSSGPASACSTSTSSVAGLRTARVSRTAPTPYGPLAATRWGTASRAKSTSHQGRKPTHHREAERQRPGRARR